MTTQKRRGFTLFQLLVILAVLALLFALFLPAVVKMRLAAARMQSQNNLRQLAIGCQNYELASGKLPPGVDAVGFSTRVYLLPYLEQANLYKLVDFNSAVDSAANQKVANVGVKTFLNPTDPAPAVLDKTFGTNYLFSAGTKYTLKDNDGVFYKESKLRIVDIKDGTSNTLMIGETLRGDGGAKVVDVHRQHVVLKKDALKGLKEESGVPEWKDGKEIAGDRCKNWMDGRFLQGTFTATRPMNDEKPDVDCGGVGGLSALRGLENGTNVALCDGSVRFVSNSISLKVWKAAATRSGGEPIPLD